MYRRYDSYGFNERSNKYVPNSRKRALETSLKDGEIGCAQTMRSSKTLEPASNTRQSPIIVWTPALCVKKGTFVAFHGRCNEKMGMEETLQET